MRSRLIAILGTASLLAVLIACSDNVPQNTQNPAPRTPQAAPTETMSVRPTRTLPPAAASSAQAAPPAVPRAGSTPGALPPQPGAPGPSLAPSTVAPIAPPAAQQPLVTPGAAPIIPIAPIATPLSPGASAPPVVPSGNTLPGPSLPGMPTATPPAAFAPTPTMAAVPNGATVAVQVANQSVAAGQTFEATIVANGVTNLGAFEFTLTYNPAVVAVQGVALNDFARSTGRSFNALGPSIDAAAGAATYGAFSLGASPAGANGSGTLATVTLRAVSSGHSDLSVSVVTLTDPQNTTQPISQRSGTSIVVQ